MAGDILKVLHVITGLNDGGAEAALFRLCLNSPQIEHVVVSMMDEGKYGPMLREAGVRVSCLRFESGRVSISGLVQLFREIRQSSPDVVQTWMYHANLIGGVAAKIAGVKRIIWGIHHFNIDEGMIKAKTRFVLKLGGFLSRFIPNGVVSCSRAAVPVHVEAGYLASQFSVIPNGYDLGRFRPDAAARCELRRELGLTDDRFTLSMVARYDIQKDHPNLFAALKLLRGQGTNFVCLLVGHGMTADNAELMALIADNDLQNSIRLLGKRTDVERIMNASDIHVLSSRGEAFPNVLAEAMACGTPCVSTNVGDAARILDAFGWVVPVRDPEALAKAVVAAYVLSTDTLRWQEIKLNAALHISINYEIRKMCQAYETVWRV